jgi:precorrin-6B methylase 2
VGERSDGEFTFPEPPEGLVTAPENRVVANMDSPQAVAEAIDDLAEAGFERDEIFVLCGAKGAERLDVSGRDHGLKGRIYRIIERIGDERELLLRLEEHLTAGGLMVSVPATEDAKATAARILGEHGGHEMAHFGKGHWEPVGS